MDVYLSEVPRARAGHGAVRGDDQREPGADAGHRRAGEPRRGAGHLRDAGRSRASVDRHGHRHAAASGCSTASTARCSADIPAASLDEDAPLYDRPLARPADRAARRADADAAAGPGRLRRRPARAARRPHVGVPPVRPPAVPQHRRGPGRRRHRAAPEAPHHRASTPAGAWPSPATATTGGARSTRARAPRWSWPRRC